MYYQKIICLVTLLICVLAQEQKNQSSNENEPILPPNTNNNTNTNTDVNATTTLIPQIMIKNEHNFCLFLPPKPGDRVAETEDDAIPFCMQSENIPEGAKKFPNHFITTAHYYKTNAYEQVTGFFDRDAYKLKKEDGGGQLSHAKHKPIGAICQGYDYFVSLIEPTNNRFCLRCCKNSADCPTGRSEYGCQRVVIPGNYDETNTFDHVAPPLPTTTTMKPTPTPKTSKSTPSTSNLPSSSTPPPSNQPSSSPSPSSPSSLTTTTTTTAPPPTTTPPNDQPGEQPGDDPSKGVPSNGDPSNGEDPSDGEQLDQTNQPIDTNPSVNNNNNDAQPANFLVKTHTKRSVIKKQVRHLKRQLNHPRVDLNQVRSQFTSIIQNYSSMKPQLKKRLEKLNDHAHSLTTIDQWKDFMKTRK